MSEDDVTDWILRARSGDEEAAGRIWAKYVRRLLTVASRSLRNLPRRSFDEEDIAQSAMNSFFQGMKEKRFDNLKRRDELWRILVTITARKAIAAQRRHFAKKRGAGKPATDLNYKDPFGSQVIDGVEQLMGNEPTPEFALMVAEEIRVRFETLPAELREVAELKLEGYTNEEVATRLKRTTRSIERKLQRIRQAWSEDPQE